MWPKNLPPPPPVPAGVREMLKDYPEILQDLQDVLNDVVIKPAYGTPPFEMAIWRLKDTLEDWLVEAREAHEAAEAGGDAQTIERAKKKWLSIAHSRHAIYNGGLKEYFEQYRGAFE